jgi:hypothetical protein
MHRQSPDWVESRTTNQIKLFLPLPQNCVETYSWIKISNSLWTVKAPDHRLHPRTSARGLRIHLASAIWAMALWLKTHGLLPISSGIIPCCRKWQRYFDRCSLRIFLCCNSSADGKACDCLISALDSCCSCWEGLNEKRMYNFSWSPWREEPPVEIIWEIAWMLVLTVFK